MLIARALLIGNARAAALEPPASEQEMTAKTSVVVRVEVESVECLGLPEQEGDWEVTRYRATLRRIEALKGNYLLCCDCVGCHNTENKISGAGIH
jgi:hypothetical protein